MTIKLYGHPESGHSYKVKLMLALADIEHEYEVADILIPRTERAEPFRSLSLSRFGEVPLLVSDEDVIAQSNSILIYLSERYRVYGAEDLTWMARVREWLFWESNKIGLSLPHLRLARNYFPEQFSEGAVQWLQSRYDEDSGKLETQLSDGRSFITGERMSIADLSICGYFFWSNQAEVQVPPFTKEWLARIASLPNWQSPYRMLDPSGQYETFGRIRTEYVPQ